MRKVVVWLACGLALSGCLAMEPPPVTNSMALSKAHVATIEAGTRTALKDPNSAMFGSMRAARDANGIVYVCGSVNAKNSFGGYTGMKPFTGILSETSATFVVTGLGGDDTDNWAVNVMCKRYGLPI